MKKLPSLLILLFCGSVWASSMLEQKPKLYRVYIVNDTCNHIEYTVKSAGLNIIPIVGKLFPKNGCKNRIHKFGNYKSIAKTWGPGLPWVKPLGLLLGDYEVCIRYQNEKDWKCYTKTLKESDYTDSLIPYWEISSENE